jgi:putative addiction module component (TIGR02574 family)
LPVGGFRCAMNATLEQIAQEALRLAPAQRAELADFLAGSLDITPPDEVQRLWLEEAARRLAEVRSGQVETIPVEDVLAEARRLVGR